MYQCVAVGAYVLLQYSRKITCFAAQQSCSIYVYTNRFFFSIHWLLSCYKLLPQWVAPNASLGNMLFLIQTQISSWNNPVTFCLPNCHVKHHIIIVQNLCSSVMHRYTLPSNLSIHFCRSHSVSLFLTKSSMTTKKN